MLKMFIYTLFYLLIHIGSVKSEDYTNVFSISNLFRLIGIDIDETKGEVNNFPLPPQHMLELYEIYSDKQYHNLKYKDANIVRSFSYKGKSGVKWHYLFDLKEAISKDEEILGAELRLFLDRKSLNLQKVSHPFIKIQVFEGQVNETSRLPLEERTVSAYLSGWEEFSVKSSVEKWCSNPELKPGFSLRIVDSNGQNLSNQGGLQFEKNREPVLIVYSRNSRIMKSTFLNGELSRSLQTKLDEIPTQKRSSEEELSRSIRAASKSKSNLCRKHALKINFTEVGWCDWVIRPEWYNAYACKGACVFGQMQNTTVHSRMQSLVHHLGLTEEAPCCVPTELEPLAILFYDKDSNPILAQFDEMVVTHCGCR